MATAVDTSVKISASQALAIAQRDAVGAYGDLSPFRIEIDLGDEGWRIDYVVRKATTKGGGPHYVIDAETGAILSKRYEQ